MVIMKKLQAIISYSSRKLIGAFGDVAIRDVIAEAAKNDLIIEQLKANLQKLMEVQKQSDLVMERLRAELQEVSDYQGRKEASHTR